MQKFYFLRHGETDWNAQNRIQGHQPDIPLNPLGLAQSRQAAIRLEAVELATILTSPLLRARQTADAVNAGRNLPLIDKPCFLERNPGSWEGQHWADIMAQHKATEESRMSDYFPPDAETHTDMDTRVHAGLLQCLNEVAAPFLIVAHGAVFRALSQTLLGVSQYCPNAIPYLFQNAGQGWQVQEI